MAEVVRSIVRNAKGCFSCFGYEFTPSVFVPLGRMKKKKMIPKQLLNFPILMCLIAASTTILAQPCIDGFAGMYPCEGIHQYAFMPADEMGGGVINDNWGWVSSETGREYAIQARSSGTSFIDITDPANPVYLGNLPTHDFEILWRDVKVYSNHAFIVAESGGHGMQVFDLTQLDAVVNPPVDFSETAHYPLFGNAHNVAINEESGYAYAVGTNTYSGGLHFINIQDPQFPVAAGGFEADGYTHDVQVVNYDGFDANYVGREMAFASNENSLTIVDVTDKSDPVMVSRTEYENSAYAHQGWLTEDHRYFLLGDELDEGTFGNNTRTFVWDLLNLEEPELVGYIESDISSIDHNLYFKGGYCYQANYTGGLRVLKMNNPATLDFEEVAFFDVIPENDNVQFIGAWNVYPFFPSGTIILSNMYQGMHILQPDFDPMTGINQPNVSQISCYPNPSSDFVRIEGVSSESNSVEVFNSTGRMVLSQGVSNSGVLEIDVSNLSPGLYLLLAGNDSIRLVIQ